MRKKIIKKLLLCFMASGWAIIEAMEQGGVVVTAQQALALMDAIASGEDQDSAQEVQKLIARGYSLRFVPTEGISPLSFAVNRGKLETVRVILNAHRDDSLRRVDPCAYYSPEYRYYDSQGNGVYSFKQHGLSPLQCVCTNHLLSEETVYPIVELLLQAGADPCHLAYDIGSKFASPEPHTARDLAIKNKYMKVATLLRGAERKEKSDLFEKEKQALTQLSLEELQKKLLDAVQHGNNKLVKYLLDEHRVSPNFAESISWLSPLAAAANTGNLKTVKILLKYKADPNLRRKDGPTPLHALCRNDLIPASRKCGIAKLLLRYGADPNIKSINPSRAYPNILITATNLTRDTKVCRLLNQYERVHFNEQEDITNLNDLFRKTDLDKLEVMAQRACDKIKSEDYEKYMLLSKQIRALQSLQQEHYEHAYTVIGKVGIPSELCNRIKQFVNRNVVTKSILADLAYLVLQGGGDVSDTFYKNIGMRIKIQLTDSDSSLWIEGPIYDALIQNYGVQCGLRKRGNYKKSKILPESEEQKSETVSIQENSIKSKRHRCALS